MKIDKILILSIKIMLLIVIWVLQYINTTHVSHVGTVCLAELATGENASECICL